MALRMGALYDALRSAPGITEESARLAAEEVANYDNKIAGIQSDLLVVKWMLGTVIALMLGQFWMLMNLLARLPR